MGNESPTSSGPTRFLVWLTAASGLALVALAPERILAHRGEVQGGPGTEVLAETFAPVAMHCLGGSLIYGLGHYAW